MEKTTKKRVRNVVLGVTSAALVAGITSALTLAMLSDTHSKVNTFTTSPELKAALYEPDWDNQEYNPLTNGGTTGSRAPETLGETLALKYIPGDPIPKNPYIANQSNEPEYVAIRVTYQVNCDKGDWHTISPTDFSKYFATYNDDTTKWKKLTSTDLGATAAESTDKADYYLYATSAGATPINSKATTGPLFTQVTPVANLNKYSTDPTGDKLMFAYGSSGTPSYESTPLLDIGGEQIEITVGNKAGLPEFRVVVIGAAMQTKNYAASDTDTISKSLYKVFPEITNKQE